MESVTQIRLLTPQDADQYQVLRLEALKNEPQSFGATYEEAVNRPLSEVANRLQANKDSFILGAFQANPTDSSSSSNQTPELIGVVGLYRRDGAKLKHKGVVWGMYVAPAGRNQGLGRRLMQSLIDQAIELSTFEQLLLTVVTTNQSARQLYLSLGFKSYGIETTALKIENAYLDEDLMMLQL